MASSAGVPGVAPLEVVGEPRLQSDPVLVVVLLGELAEGLQEGPVAGAPADVAQELVLDVGQGDPEQHVQGFHFKEMPQS